MQDDSLESAERFPPLEEIVIGEEMSWWAQALNGVFLLVLALASAGFVWVMSSLPRIEGRIPVTGLQLPATVARDHYGVPRISTRTVRDAYFTLGWVHAQDRIWQMEFQRRVGAGRLSELVGDKGLANDRFMRTLGLHRLAEQGFDLLDKPTRDALVAYSEGVNSWLDAHRHRLPLEFLLLGATPEPWTPADSLVWGRLMALQLTGDWRADLLRDKLADRLPPARIAELWPQEDGPVTVPTGRRAADGLLDVVPEQARPRLASNVWAVNGKRTASGKPLLANDPHLGFQAPVLWYLASIEAPGLSVAGATVPGVPFHLIGHNQRIAWGTTTTHADTVDLFVETDLGDGTYATPDGPKPFAVREEIIRVKGGDDVVLTVRESRHGPVIGDLLPGTRDPGRAVAFRATALEPADLTAQALHRMNRAVDWKGFLGALSDFHAPVQNFAYADTAGTIGFATAGRVPVRASGDGGLPVSAGEGEWTGWIPWERMPRLVDPKSGQVVNANNRVVGPGYPHLISAHWPEGFRAARIAALLEGREGLTVEDMAAMQMDDLSLAAVVLKELVADIEPGSALARDALRLVKAWGGRMDRDRPEPLVFNAWMERLWRNVFADELGGDFAAYGGPRPVVLANALTVDRHWCDDVATAEAESCAVQAARALEAAVDELAARHGPAVERWRWGDVHRAVFAHPVLSQVPLLGRWARVSVPMSGDDFTVNRGTFAPGSFTQVHGAGLRAVYDLADLSRSRFTLAVGQSGNLLSRHFGDTTGLWQANDGLLLGGRQPETAVLTLEPSY